MSTSLRYTTSDLEGLPTIDGVRYEIIDGDLYVSRPPHWHHQYVGGQVWRALQDWNDKTSTGIAIEAPGVVFAPDENVAPDVVWISRARLPHIFSASGHLRAAPELVVEVLSPGAENERRDRELKLKLYSRQPYLAFAARVRLRAVADLGPRALSRRQLRVSRAVRRRCAGTPGRRRRSRDDARGRGSRTPQPSPARPARRGRR